VKNVKRRKTVQWSKEESILLKKLKEKGGSWEKISKSFPGRDWRSCFNRHNKYINEGEKRAQGVPWSKEHSLLLKKLKEKGLSYEKISKSFPGRDAISCKNRYNHINEGEKIEKIARWSKEHSLLLKKLKEKGQSWEKIAKSFPGRDVRSCQGRYDYIKVGEKRVYVSWSKEQDLLMKKLKGKGQSWEKIAKSFPGRTAGSCRVRFQKIKGASHSSKGAARASNRDSNDSNDDDEDSNSSNNEDNDEEAAAASEPSPAADPLADDDILPPVISSSSTALTYYPPPLPPRKQRRKFGSSGARRDERLIGEFCCWICTRLIFRAQVMRPCGCHVFCEECVPPNLDARTSACYTCSTPFEQALPYRTGNNIAEEMVRARFVKADVADEWRNRGAEYAREQRAE
jgi:hypothetical protein